jgi:raffinose/stachyose/melibiose transport system permease protein
MSDSPVVSQRLPTPGTGQARSIRGSMKVDRFLVALSSHTIMIIFTLIVVYPLIWMVFASFKTRSEVTTNIWGPPQSLSPVNYVEAWQRAKLGFALTNSVIVSISVVILVACLAALAGYAFARFSFRFSLPIFLVFVFTMQAGAPIIPLYVMLVKMHLTDSRLGLILPMVAGGLPLSIFIFRAFFQSIPRELLDAAKVDGCTELAAFLKVVIPISGPAFATVAILQFVGAWNEYFLALILIRSPERQTIPLAIQVFFYTQGRTYWEQVFAALCIASLPIIILYMIMQRQFIQGLTAGAVKG